MRTLSLLVAVLLSAATPASAADKLTVLLDWFVNPDHAALVIAQERGLFAQAGLEVELVAPADPSAPPRLVAAGPLWLTQTPPPTVPPPRYLVFKTHCLAGGVKPRRARLQRI